MSWSVLSAPVLRSISAFGVRVEWARQVIVCKSWREASESDELWRRQFSSEFGDEPAAAAGHPGWKRRLQVRLTADRLLWQGNPVVTLIAKPAEKRVGFTVDVAASELFVTAVSDTESSVFEIPSGRVRESLNFGAWLKGGHSARTVQPCTRVDGSRFFLGHDDQNHELLHFWDTWRGQLQLVFTLTGHSSSKRHCYDVGVDAQGRELIAFAGGVWLLPPRDFEGKEPEQVAQLEGGGRPRYHVLHVDIRAGLWVARPMSDEGIIGHAVCVLELTTGRELRRWQDDFSPFAYCEPQLSAGRCLALATTPGESKRFNVECVDLISGRRLQLWTEAQWGGRIRSGGERCAMNHRFAIYHHWKADPDAFRLLCLRTGRVRVLPLRRETCSWLALTRDDGILMFARLSKQQTQGGAVSLLRFEAPAAAAGAAAGEERKSRSKCSVM